MSPGSRPQVEAEVYLSAPAVRRRVMSELLRHTLEAFLSVLSEQLQGGPDLLSGADSYQCRVANLVKRDDGYERTAQIPPHESKD